MVFRKKKDNDDWTLASEPNTVERDLFFKNSKDPFKEEKAPKKKKEKKPKYIYKNKDTLEIIIEKQVLCGVGMSGCGAAIIGLGIATDIHEVLPSGIALSTLGIIWAAYDYHRLKKCRKGSAINRYLYPQIKETKQKGR